LVFSSIKAITAWLADSAGKTSNREVPNALDRGSAALLDETAAPVKIGLHGVEYVTVFTRVDKSSVGSRKSGERDQKLSFDRRGNIFEGIMSASR
jgi:hypothetical protein